MVSRCIASRHHTLTIWATRTCTTQQHARPIMAAHNDMNIKFTQQSSHRFIHNGHEHTNLTMTCWILTYHITETGIGVVGLDLGTVGLRVKEERRHCPLGLGRVLSTLKTGIVSVIEQKRPRPSRIKNLFTIIVPSTSSRVSSSLGRSHLPNPLRRPLPPLQPIHIHPTWCLFCFCLQ